MDACRAFACEPWLAVYVETSDAADVYLTSLSNYDRKYGVKKGRASTRWYMRPKDRRLCSRNLLTEFRSIVDAIVLQFGVSEKT